MACTPGKAADAAQASSATAFTWAQTCAPGAIRSSRREAVPGSRVRCRIQARDVSLALVRPLKGLMVALQYQHKAEEGRLQK